MSKNQLKLLKQESKLNREIFKEILKPNKFSVHVKSRLKFERISRPLTSKLTSPEKRRLHHDFNSFPYLNQCNNICVR